MGLELGLRPAGAEARRAADAAAAARADARQVMNRLVLLFAELALGLAACSEKEQVAEFKRGKYHRKPDPPSRESAPLHEQLRREQWNQADRTICEERTNKRHLAQQEN